MAYVGARVVYALGTEVTRARELGSYRLVERLGAGRHGRSLAREASAARASGRDQAHSTGRSPPMPGGRRRQRSAARFEREAQAMASLRSPHTVNLFDFGVADDGAFYYVMELLDGLDAETLVRRFGPLPAAARRSRCSGRSATRCPKRTRGLVHRDIKPANIFLCRYGEDVDFVKVLDFGLVKALTRRRRTPRRR